MGQNSITEVSVRRATVQNMLLAGKPKREIVKYCKDNYGVALSSVEKDITAVRKDINQEFLKQKEHILETHIMRYENLYRFYMDEGTEDNPNIHFDPKTAALMLEKKEKLLHLHRPDVVVNQQNIENQQVNNYDLSNLTLKEIKEALNKND